MNSFVNCIKTEKSFFDWMIFKFGVNKDEFKNAPLYQQFQAIHTFLGYSEDFPVNWSIEQIESSIADKIYQNEIIYIDYLFDIIDPIKELKYKSNQELTSIFYNMDKANSLINCLKPIDETHRFVSLLSCLKKLERIIPPAPQFDFWEMAIKQFFNNENVPF